jgi:hypothetical protein
MAAMSSNGTAMVQAPVVIGRAIRAKLGETLRERHDLVEPLTPRLLELLAQLDIRERTKAKLYAEVDECVAAMVSAANRKPRRT